MNSAEIQGLVDDLNLLIMQPTALQSPPCKNCSEKDSSSWDRAKCSAKCDHAPYALSEEPERYPIEEHVVPLVFELTSMRLVQTCWSCEGHLDIDGEVWKLPQVGFYSKKPIYSQLICNYLAYLHWRKELYYPWEVVLTNFGGTWDVTYTIKCDLSRVKNPDINLMQKDLVNMSKDLSERIKGDARSLIRSIESYLVELELENQLGLPVNPRRKPLSVSNR